MKKNYILKKLFIICIALLTVVFLITGCSDPNTLRSDDFDEGAFLAAHSPASGSVTAGK